MPKRTNIVISRNTNFRAEGILVFSNFLDAVDFAQKDGCKEVFIIGGGEIYRQSLAVCSRIYYTEVDTIIDDASVFFPEMPEDEWELISEEKHIKDELNTYDYIFKIYERLTPVTVL